MYEIEKNIPAPTRNPPISKFLSILKTMEPGDSVMLDINDTLRSNLTHACRTQGIKTVTRKCEGGFRIWRIA